MAALHHDPYRPRGASGPERRGRPPARAPVRVLLLGLILLLAGGLIFVLAARAVGDGGRQPETPTPTGQRAALLSQGAVAVPSLAGGQPGSPPGQRPTGAPAGDAATVTALVRQVSTLTTAGTVVAQEVPAARAQALAAEAQGQLATDPQLALLLAREAIAATQAAGLPPVPAAVDALHAALAAPPAHLVLREFLQGPVRDAAWSPDGTQIVTAGEDGAARIWDVQTGKVVLKITGHRRGLWRASFSPDTQTILTASDDDTARVWGARTGQERLRLAAGGAPVRDAAWNPDGTRIATVADDGTARLWAFPSGQLLRTLPGPPVELRAVAWSPDGKSLITAGRDGLAHIWDAASGQERGRIRTADALLSVAWSTDGQTILTTEENGDARFWAPDGGDLMDSLWLISTAHGPRQAAFSPDGRLIATAGNDGTARLWALGPSRQLVVFPGHGAPVNSVAWSPDGTSLVTASDDGSARIWLLTESEELPSLIGHRAAVQRVYYSADGKSILSSSQDGTARVWDATTGQARLTLQSGTDEWGRAAYSPDGTKIAAGGRDGILHVWDWAPPGPSGRVLLAIKAHDANILGSGGIYDIAWSPDGTRLVTTSEDRTAKVWDAYSGQPLATLWGHTANVWNAGWSPDGKSIVTASQDGTAKVWDAATGRERFTLYGHTNWVWQAAYSPDGTSIATLGDTTVRLWDPATGQERLRLDSGVAGGSHFAWSPDSRSLVRASADGATVWDTGTGQVRFVLRAAGDRGGKADNWAVGFSADGKRIVGGGGGGFAEIWDAATGQELTTVRGHTDHVLDAAFSPDGCRLATAGKDGLVRQFSVCLPDLLALAARRVTRALSPAERATYLDPLLPAPSPTPASPLPPTATSPAALTPPLAGTPSVPQPTLPPAPATPPQATIPAGPGESILVFTLPRADAGGISVWSGWEGLYGFAVAPDGSFWMGDYYKDMNGGGARLLHFDSGGAPLGVLPLPDALRGLIEGLAIRNADFWLLYQTSVVRLGGAGQVLDQYPIPDQIPGDEQIGAIPQHHLGLSIGPLGDVLLGWDARDLGLVRLVDASGRLAPLTPVAGNPPGLPTLPGYPGPHASYSVELGTPPGGATMRIATQSFVVTAPHPLIALQILAVNPDGSFYLYAHEQLDQAPYFQPTLLRFDASGQLTGRALIPLQDGYVQALHRLAVGSGGRVFALVGPLEGVPIAVRELQFAAPTAILPTPAPPTPTPDLPTPTPTPTWTLPLLVQHAEGIAQAVPVPGQPKGDAGWDQFQVLRWLRPPPAEHDVGTWAVPLIGGPSATIGVFLGAAERARLASGAGSYLLFLGPGSSGWCDAYYDFYSTLGGPAGFFPVRQGRLESTVFPEYQGQPLSRLEAAIRAVATPVPEGTPPPDTSFQALAARARQAEYIADVDLMGGQGAVGNMFYGVKVRKWYKKPPDFTDDVLDMHGEKCGAERVRLGSEHYIVFLPINDDWQSSVYGVSGDRIDFGGLSRYWGWPVARFAAELSAALAAPRPTPGP